LRPGVKADQVEQGDHGCFMARAGQGQAPAASGRARGGFYRLAPEATPSTNVAAPAMQGRDYGSMTRSGGLRSISAVAGGMERQCPTPLILAAYKRARDAVGETAKSLIVYDA